MDEKQSAILRVKRRLAFQGSAAKLRLHLDNNRVDDIGNGEAKEYHIQSGQHSIKVVLWTGKASQSMNINGKNGELIELTCGIDNRGIFLMPTPPEQSKAQSQASNAQTITIVCAFAVGALFVALNFPFGNTIPGYYIQGFIGGCLGAMIGYAIAAIRRK
jgi:hypothetical protein